jgi:Tfp pilus assembly protein PilV
MNISIHENPHKVRIRLKNHCQMGLSLLEMMVTILFVGKLNLQEIETSYSSNQVNMIGFS